MYRCFIIIFSKSTLKNRNGSIEISSLSKKMFAFEICEYTLQHWCHLIIEKIAI